MSLPPKSPVAPAVPPSWLELPPTEPPARRDPWLSDPAFECGAFLAGLAPSR